MTGCQVLGGSVQWVFQWDPQMQSMPAPATPFGRGAQVSTPQRRAAECVLVVFASILVVEPLSLCVAGRMVRIDLQPQHIRFF